MGAYGGARGTKAVMSHQGGGGTQSILPNILEENNYYKLQFLLQILS